RGTGDANARVDAGAPSPGGEAAVAVAPSPAPTAAPVAAGQGGFEVTGDDIDDEIREVFLEEFAEEIDNLDQLLPLWRAQPGDMERLRPIRRVFHTLKGSGRLVGARTLGEFSWKVENMLNRVLDGTRPASPAVVAMVDQAFYTLPELQAALRGDGALRTDVGRVQASADRIAGGDEGMPEDPSQAQAVAVAPPVAADAVPHVIEPAAPAPASAVEPVVEPALAPAVGPASLEMVPASVDALLLEILEAEVAGHLVTVDAWLAGAGSAPVQASEALLRALHTMSGAF